MRSPTVRAEACNPAELRLRQRISTLVLPTRLFKIATLYSPLKLFVPSSAAFFLVGPGYYGYTYVVTSGRFTNMSVLLFSAAVIIFLIGLVSEQITALTYRWDT